MVSTSCSASEDSDFNFLMAPRVCKYVTTLTDYKYAPFFPPALLVVSKHLLSETSLDMRICARTGSDKLVLMVDLMSQYILTTASVCHNNPLLDWNHSIHRIADSLVVAAH